MSHRARRTPPSYDQLDELARFECMQLVREGTLDNWTVFVQRQAGVPWSKIKSDLLTKQQQETANAATESAPPDPLLRVEAPGPG
jgi:hypothetical protein